MKTIKTSLLIIALMAHQTSQAVQHPAQDFEEFLQQTRRMGTGVKDVASSPANSQKREHNLKRVLHYLSFGAMNLGNLSQITSYLGLNPRLELFGALHAVRNIYNSCVGLNLGLELFGALYAVRNIYNCFNSQNGLNNMAGAMFTAGGMATGKYRVSEYLACAYGFVTNEVPTLWEHVSKYVSGKKKEGEETNKSPWFGIGASALLGALLNPGEFWSTNLLHSFIPAAGIAYLSGWNSFIPLGVQLGVSSLTQSWWPYTPWIPGAVAGAIAAYASAPRLSDNLEKGVGKISKVYEYEKCVKEITKKSKVLLQQSITRKRNDLIANAQHIIASKNKEHFTLDDRKKNDLILKMSNAAQNINSIPSNGQQNVSNIIASIANSLDRHTQDYKVVLNIDPTPAIGQSADILTNNIGEPHPNKDSQIQVKDVIQYAWKSEFKSLQQELNQKNQDGTKSVQECQAKLNKEHENLKKAVKDLKKFEKNIPQATTARTALSQAQNNFDASQGALEQAVKDLVALNKERSSHQKAFYEFEAAMLKEIKSFKDKRECYTKAVGKIVESLDSSVQSISLDWATDQFIQTNSINTLLRSTLELIQINKLNGGEDLKSPVKEYLEKISTLSKKVRLYNRENAREKRTPAISACLKNISEKFKPLEKELATTQENKRRIADFYYAMKHASIVDNPFEGLLNPLTTLICGLDGDIGALYNLVPTIDQKNKLEQKINMKNELNNLKKLIENNFGNGALDINI